MISIYLMEYFQKFTDSVKKVWWGEQPDFTSCSTVANDTASAADQDVSGALQAEAVEEAESRISYANDVACVEVQDIFRSRDDVAVGEKSLVSDTFDIKYTVLRQLEEISKLEDYQSGDELAVIGRLDAAFTQKVSTSVFVVGPHSSEKRQLLDRVLAKYEKHSCSRNPVITARISGLQCSSDSQALTFIVDQFLVRDQSKKSSTQVLVDLETLLRVSICNLIKSKSMCEFKIFFDVEIATTFGRLSRNYYD